VRLTDTIVGHDAEAAAAESRSHLRELKAALA